MEMKKDERIVCNVPMPSLGALLKGQSIKQIFYDSFWHCLKLIDNHDLSRIVLEHVLTPLHFNPEVHGPPCLFECCFVVVKK